MGQVSTWENIILYSFVPQALAGVLAFAVLWIAHARALKIAGHRVCASSAIMRALQRSFCLFVGSDCRVATIDGWTIVRYLRRAEAPASLPQAWRDPVFGNRTSVLPLRSSVLLAAAWPTPRARLRRDHRLLAGRARLDGSPAIAGNAEKAVRSPLTSRASGCAADSSRCCFACWSRWS